MQSITVELFIQNARRLSIGAQMTQVLQPPMPTATDAGGLTWKLVVAMGLSQLICWGTLHYLIALFASPIGQEMQWSSAKVQSGFSVAMLVMAGLSYPVGRWIDQRGGRTAMMTGCWVGSVGCLLLSVVETFPAYLAAWVVIGAGMRLALYDSAFASLSYVAGSSAKRAISIVAIFGGLASTVFWPLGQYLSEAYGWRGALRWYAAILLAASLLHLTIPKARTEADVALRAGARGLRQVQSSRVILGLYAYGAIGVLILQTGMAAHLLTLLGSAGWGLGVAVWVATMLGLGQFSGRLLIALWAYRFNPVSVNLVPGILQALCFGVYLVSGQVLLGALAFAFLYGAGNGMATYTRGAMPLVLFDPARYGRIVGLVMNPALALAALAPIGFGLALDKWGGDVVAGGALGLALTLTAASIAIHWYVRINQGAEEK